MAESNYDQNNLLLNKDLSQLRAQDVLMPVSKVVFVHLLDPLQKVRESAFENYHSYYPVYDDGIDNIVGVLHVKDIFVHKEPFVILENLKSPVFVSENTKIDEVLLECLKSQVFFAVVVDEYGAVRGVITKTNILAALSPYEPSFDNLADLLFQEDKPYFLDAEMPLREFNQRFRMDLDSESCETIGGYVIDQFTYVPRPGEKLVLGRFVLSVMRVEGAKLEELMLVLLKK